MLSAGARSVVCTGIVSMEVLTADRDDLLCAQNFSILCEMDFLEPDESDGLFDEEELLPRF